MAKMVQGDRYSLPIKLKQGEVVLTSANVDGIRIKVGKLEKRYPGSDLSYSFGNAAWMFPVTQEETLSMYGPVPVQAEIVIGNDIFRSTVTHVGIENSIIRTPWEENDESD